MSNFEPTHIIGKIYQNGYIDEVRGAKLVELGITHILNLDLPYDSTFIDMSALELKITEILLYDMAPMSQSIAQRVIAIMHRSLDIEGGTLYVHCNAGVSRSPTAVWLYLVTHGTSEDEATKIIDASAPHLFGADWILIKELNIPQLAEWVKKTRWELWCNYGFTQHLEKIFETHEAALAAMELLEKKNKDIAKKHFRIEEVC